MSVVVKAEKLSHTFGSGKSEFKALRDVTFETKPKRDNA